jgi:hypothetical protein
MPLHRGTHPSSAFCQFAKKRDHVVHCGVVHVVGSTSSNDDVCDPARISIRLSPFNIRKYTRKYTLSYALQPLRAFRHWRQSIVSPGTPDRPHSCYSTTHIHRMSERLAKCYHRQVGTPISRIVLSSSASSCRFCMLIFCGGERCEHHAPRHGQPVVAAGPRLPAPPAAAVGWPG